MAYLAAHEIGELAAILGDNLDFPLSTNESTFEKCWNWLHFSAKEEYTGAVRIAVANFRKKLIGNDTTSIPRGAGDARVLPQDWAAMRNWALKMSEDPKPLNSKYDIGVTYTLASGVKDCIYFHSLFADSKFDLQDEPLPSKCYSLQTVEDPERLDGNSMPRIGAFIESLSTLHGDYERAVDVTRRLKECTDRQTESLPLSGINSNQAKALVIFFQLLRKEHHNFTKIWKGAFRNWKWDRKQLRLIDEISPANSMFSKLNNLLRRFPDGVFDLDDLVGATWCGEVITMEDIDNDWFRFHLNVLRDAGLIEEESDNCYFRLDIEFEKTPPIPFELYSDLKLVGADSAVFIRDSLGYWQSTNASRDQGADISNGFGLGGATAGRNFRDEFLKGNGPFWLKELCRQYVKHELEWLDKYAWPTSIRR